MIHIRLCTSKDLPALVPLYRDFFTLHRQFLGNTEPLADAEAREITLDALNQPQSWTIAAEDSQTGQLIGFARWEERDGTLFGREIFVRPDHRGRRRDGPERSASVTVRHAPSSSGCASRHVGSSSAPIRGPHAGVVSKMQKLSEILPC